MPTPDPRTMEAISGILAFDTVSRNSNLGCIDWARAHLEAHGATTRMDWNADRTKANMLATFGEGPGGLFSPAMSTWSPSMASPGRSTPSPRP